MPPIPIGRRVTLCKGGGRNVHSKPMYLLPDRRKSDRISGLYHAMVITVERAGRDALNASDAQMKSKKSPLLTFAEVKSV